MDSKWASEYHDYRRIEKLNKLENPATFWKDVCKLTEKVRSDHAMRRWQCLAECRAKEIGA